jgi:uncharacterized protein
VYALAGDVLGHADYRAWLDETMRSGDVVGVSDLALGGFLRIVTNPRVTRAPLSIAQAHAVTDAVRDHPAVVVVAPGDRHWSIFRGLCISANAKGNLVADAVHAAIAIEHNADFITTDGDFARFPGLRWRHPLRPA